MQTLLVGGGSFCFLGQHSEKQTLVMDIYFKIISIYQNVSFEIDL